jgi:hypothetical protein
MADNEKKSTRKMSVSSNVAVNDTMEEIPPPPKLPTMGALIEAPPQVLTSTDPIMLTPDTVRDFAMKLVQGYVPFDAGDAKYAEVCKDYGNVGTTCGYLPQWMLWRLGVRDPKIVNRTEPQDGLHYTVGANISMLWQGSKYPFVDFHPGILPKPCDIGYVSNGPPLTEHVFVILAVTPNPDGTFTLTVAEAGQTNTEGKQCARIHHPVLSHRTVGSRTLIGWLSLDNLTYSAPALLVGPDGSPLA